MLLPNIEKNDGLIDPFPRPLLVLDFDFIVSDALPMNPTFDEAAILEVVVEAAGDLAMQSVLAGKKGTEEDDKTEYHHVKAEIAISDLIV